MHIHIDMYVCMCIYICIDMCLNIAETCYSVFEVADTVAILGVWVLAITGGREVHSGYMGIESQALRVSH